MLLTRIFENKPLWVAQINGVSRDDAESRGLSRIVNFFGLVHAILDLVPSTVYAETAVPAGRYCFGMKIANRDAAI